MFANQIWKVIIATQILIFCFFLIFVNFFFNYFSFYLFFFHLRISVYPFFLFFLSLYFICFLFSVKCLFTPYSDLMMTSASVHSQNNQVHRPCCFRICLLSLGIMISKRSCFPDTSFFFNELVETCWISINVYLFNVNMTIVSKTAWIFFCLLFFSSLIFSLFSSFSKLHFYINFSFIFFLVTSFKWPLVFFFPTFLYRYLTI